MKAFKTAAAACVAAFCAGAAHAETTTPDTHAVLMQQLANVSLRTQKSLTNLVIASAETRLRSKIDNLTVQRPYPRTLPAFTVASAFTD